jgi:DNA-binding LacI/PurR family transcriptional regulator
LLILGHRRIGFVFSHEETLRTTSVHERWQGYCKALQKYGVPYDETLVVPDFRQPQMDTHVGLVKFLERPDRPDGIFAVNDYVALDVMQAAKAINLRIPEDLAIVGFDDLAFAPHLNPPLTTVMQPFMDIGLRAGTLVIGRIEGIVGAPKHIELPTNLIIRESCGAQLHVKRFLSLSQENIKEPPSTVQQKDVSHS